MPTRKLFFLLLILAAVSGGCGIQPRDNCTPVLMPYVEYGYRADPQKLSGAHVQKGAEIIDFHGVKLALPRGWAYQTIFGGRTIQFSRGRNRFFLLSFMKSKLFRNDDVPRFKVPGCRSFSVKNLEKKASKEFYTALYLFTDDQLDDSPTFWQYYILWAKTKFLRDAVKLVHYTGENLEAFQRNFDYGACGANAGTVTQSEIFPNKIAPDYLTIVTDIRDDAFFAEFLEMLNAMNP